MTEAVSPRHTVFVPIVVKKQRVVGTCANEAAMLNFHTFRAHGGVLSISPRGKGYYVRRVVGQDVKAVMNQLTDIAHQRQEAVNVL